MISAPSLKCNMNATNYSTSTALASTLENLPPYLTLSDGNLDFPLHCLLCNNIL